MARADELWIPLVDEPIGSIVARVQDEDPELVHHALSLFVTHSRQGRRLVKPRTVAAEPRKFPPSG